jgi:hypothetical protein
MLAAHWLSTHARSASYNSVTKSWSISVSAGCAERNASLRDAVILHDVAAPRQVRHCIGLGSAAGCECKRCIHAQQHERMQRRVWRPQDEHALRTCRTLTLKSPRFDCSATVSHESRSYTIACPDKTNCSCAACD